ncbi:MAG: hypothetical protein FWF99_00020 [Desulfovibrionaceae bacterium]|nr:hypothetical protein [Desulfovibrionaceae bacterium]
MARLWFLDYLGKYVNKDTMREMCAAMELDELETRLILERFCGRKNVGQCDFIPEDQQKGMMQSLDTRVQGWVERNKNHFLMAELRQVLKFFDQREG